MNLSLTAEVARQCIARAPERQVRIAINAVSVGERHTGTQTYTCGLIECLGGLGHQISVYGSSPLLPSGEAIRVRKTSSRLAFGNGPVAAIVRLLWTNVALPAFLGSEVDLLISPSVEASLRCPVPQVVVVHDLIPLFYPKEAPRLHTFYRRMVPQLLRRASAVVTVSENTRQDVLREFGLEAEKVRVVYNGLRSTLADAANERKPKHLECERYFLFVGTFAPRKNLQTLVQALVKVRRDLPEYLVIVAYPDNWSAEIGRCINDCGLSDRVVWLSGLEEDEMNYVYRHATALFLLSEYEGFGYPPLEAMLAGTPAVVSNSTSLAEIAGDAALKLDPHNADAAATAMLRLSQDQDCRRRLQHAGYEQARQFSWARAGTEWGRILCDIAGR